MRFVDPVNVPPTAAEIDDALIKFFEVLNDPDGSGFISLGGSRRLFLRALIAADPRARDKGKSARRSRV